MDHLYGFFSAFNANAVKDAQLYKGGFGAKFGGRTNAVAELTGKDGNSKRFNLGGDVSLLSVNAVAEAPIGSKNDGFDRGPPLLERATLQQTLR